MYLNGVQQKSYGLFFPRWPFPMKSFGFGRRASRIFRLFGTPSAARTTRGGHVGAWDDGEWDWVDDGVTVVSRVSYIDGLKT